MSLESAKDHWEETFYHLNEMCRQMENVVVAAQAVEESIKELHSSFTELKPYLYQPSEN